MIVAERIKELKKQADRLEDELCDAQIMVESLEDSISDIELEIEKLKAVKDLGQYTAFVRDGLTGLVLYRLKDLFRVAVRWWDGTIYEEWLRPLSDDYTSLSFSESLQVYDEFKAKGAI